MAFIYQTGGSGALATKCGMVTGLSLSKNNVGWEDAVSLTWEAAQDGVANPVQKYAIYKNGVIIGYSDGCEATVFAPGENGSDTYCVQAIGRIDGFSGVLSNTVALTAYVTDPTPPLSLTFGSVNEVATGATVTLSWAGATGGENNEIVRYNIYRDGSLVATTDGVSLQITAPTESGRYSYRVAACGVHTDSEKSREVILTVGKPYDVVWVFTDTEVTVPLWARKTDITCIGGGAGGCVGGSYYGNFEAAWPGGGAGGATGEIKHLFGANVVAGTSYAVSVGKGGMADNGEYSSSEVSGSPSSFGSLLVARGGSMGSRGGNEPTDINQKNVPGGRGGNGGIGGNGGGCGRGNYSAPEYHDADDGSSTMDWQNWGINDWYVFKEQWTGRRLGLGGRGGDGMSLYSFSTRYPVGLSTSQAPGVCYGGGGRGGDQKKDGPVTTPGSGQDGLVAIRYWRFNGTTVK